MRYTSGESEPTFQTNLLDRATLICATTNETGA